MIREAVLEEIFALPADERLRIIDLIKESLEKETHIEQTAVPKKRTLGLGAHIGFWISPDFNDPLPDEIWAEDDDLFPPIDQIQDQP